MPTIDVKYINEKLTVNINGEYKIISTEETIIDSYSVSFTNEFYKTMEITNDKLKSDSIIQFAFVGDYIEEYVIASIVINVMEITAGEKIKLSIYCPSGYYGTVNFKMIIKNI